MGAAAAAAGTTVAGGAFSAYEEGQAGKAQSSYYNYLSNTALLNAGLATSQGTAAKEQIGASENQAQIGLTNRVNTTIGAEKTAMVSGVGGSSRSAQQIIGDTLNKGDLDEMALRLNADTAAKNADITAQSGAMNYTSQASGYNIAGAVARGTAGMQQFGSLLGSAGSVANSYYMGSLYAGRGYNVGGGSSNLSAGGSDYSGIGTIG